MGMGFRGELWRRVPGRCGDIFCKDDQGHLGTWLSLMVDDVDEYYGSIKDSGVKILSKPDSKEWNIRGMLVECLDGHILRIGHNTSCD